MKLRLFALVLFIVNCPVFAQDISSPREQLKQYVADLQKSPDDQALREKIIKLALTLDPKPATPEEAERFMARGQAALEISKESKDYAQSIAEFQKAALTAPWLGNVYYNLGFVQDKAGDFAAALRNLKLYLLARPNASDEKEVKALIYKIEYKQEQAAKDAEAAESDRQKNGGLYELRDLVKGKQYAYFTCKSEGSNVCKWKDYNRSNWFPENSPTLRHWDFRDGIAIFLGSDGRQIFHVRSNGPSIRHLIWEYLSNGTEWYPAPFVDLKTDGSVFTVGVNVDGKRDAVPSLNPERYFNFSRFSAQ